MTSRYTISLSFPVALIILSSCYSDAVPYLLDTSLLEIPILPKPELPTLPELPIVPELPKPELPTIPEPPKVHEIPTLPKVELPPLPEWPKIPTIATIKDEKSPVAAVPIMSKQQTLPSPVVPTLPMPYQPPLPELPKFKLPPLPEFPIVAGIPKLPLSPTTTPVQNTLAVKSP